MGLLIDVGHLFNSPDYSDITIRFSDREIKCHQFILCSTSEYFVRICGPNSRFSESQQTVIELHDDNPEALEEVRRYVYSGKYPSDTRQSNWAFHLEVAKVAGKYLFVKLEDAAFQAFQQAISSDSEPLEILNAIESVRAAYVKFEGRLSVAAKLERNNILALLRDPGVRSKLDGRKDLMWKYLDLLVDFAMSFGTPAPMEDLSKITFCWCRYCHQYCRGTADELGFSPDHDTYCAHSGYNCSAMTFDVWLPRDCAEHISTEVGYDLVEDEEGPFRSLSQK